LTTLRIINDKNRGLIRKFGFRTKSSSYPFLSGDTYRRACNIDLDADMSEVAKLLTIGPQIDFFVSVDNVPKLLKCLIDFKSSEVETHRLFIHNGDKIPNFEAFSFLREYFTEIHSVNWFGNIPGILPIPIGLENRSLMRNGIPSDYSKIIKSGLKKFEDRNIRLLIAFNISTNTAERSEALRFASSIPGAFVVPPGTHPRDYQVLLSDSQFVVSPPGNGEDCHRTWESMYLGAIPIVKRKFWPFTNYVLPALVIEDWSDLENEILKFTNVKPIVPEDLLRTFGGPFSKNSFNHVRDFGEFRVLNQN